MSSDAATQSLAQLNAPRLRVGFCGIGLMGGPMAGRVMASGYPLQVWNRSAAKLADLLAAGATAAPTPAALAEHSEVVLMCVLDGPAVEQVVFGPNGLLEGALARLRAGGSAPTLVDHSTIAPDISRRLAARWYERTGGNWIDAPVSGGVSGAANGTLAIMAGGDAAALEAVQPVLRCYSARVTRMGDAGAGQAAKLVNQAIVMTTIAGITEACVLALRSGIDAAAIPAALKGGWADSVLLQTLMPRMVKKPENIIGASDTMLKDADAVAALAKQSGVTLDVVQRARALLQSAHDAGLGDADISQIIRVAGGNRV